jgi:hypothetical protein
LIHALATRGRKKGGEKLHCIPRNYPKSQGGACAFLLHFLAFVGCGLLYEIGLTGFGGTGLTSFGNRPDRFVPRVGSCSGEFAYVQGEILYALVVCAL